MPTSPRTTVHRVHRASCVVAERKPGVAPTDLTDADVPLPPPNGPLGEAVAALTELALFRCVCLCERECVCVDRVAVVVFF